MQLAAEPVVTDRHDGRMGFGHALWRKDWVKVFIELAQDRRAWSASVVGNSIGDAGSLAPGECRRKCTIDYLSNSTQ